ncbi:hypothetical protein UFOVP399_51 [uncultured Caudovirales phage]|uniref:DUF5681 domain-containing protein n=1 Tax=uncultured Caudovirales phage TaxID=2100421 RepID=A0A6J5MB96_9CAUD|nr:hypothetical protein UFOVP399_51 [uncultured Caudovirales phage]
MTAKKRNQSAETAVEAQVGPESTGQKRGNVPPVGKRFEPGNPGRPKGSRNKLGEAFLADMLADWEEYGVQVIATVRAEKPDVYLKTVASILPQQLNVKVSDLDDLDDTELDRRIAALARALELEIGTGTAAVREGQAAPGKPLN